MQELNKLIIHKGDYCTLSCAAAFFERFQRSDRRLKRLTPVSSKEEESQITSVKSLHCPGSWKKLPEVATADNDVPKVLGGSALLSADRQSEMHK